MKSLISNLKSQILSFRSIIIVILIFSAFLRLYRIDEYMTFLGDEGRDVLVVYNILHGNLTLLGPTASVGGFFLGPAYYYFMTPFLWFFNYNPVGPAVMVALFGVATVWLVYKAGDIFFNKKVGIISALLYSISPLVIAYSRSSWNPNLMPFFSLLTLLILYKALEKNKAWLIILSGLMLGITIQLHYLATFLSAILFFYILIFRIFKDSKGSLLPLLIKLARDYYYISLGFIIGISPFLTFEFRHGFQNIQSIISFVISSGDTGAGINLFRTVYDAFFRLFARLITSFPPPEQVSLKANVNIFIWYLGSLVLGIISISIFLTKFIALYRERKKENSAFLKFLLIFLWFFVGVGLFGFYKKSIYDYYFGFIFPLPFLLVGNALDFFIRKNKIFVIFAISILLILIIINLNGIPFKYSPNRQLKQVEAISRSVVEVSEGKPFNFALVSGNNSDHAYRYFFTLWNQTPISILNPQVDPKRESVTNQLIIVCETLPCHPLGHSLWEIAGFGRAEIAEEWNVSVVKIYKLRHYKEAK
ncbi:MAG: glycosyltransferase family 39 protein [Candidatus Levybacteria bacterium]|nr:glycosyltransferase family 39 protein [Candidatus Levybacteria bacterium]